MPEVNSEVVGVMLNTEVRVMINTEVDAAEVVAGM
jgi:hypothetical protein